MAKLVGEWFFAKYRRQAAETGVARVAKNLRKQGVPIEVALAILVYR